MCRLFGQRNVERHEIGGLQQRFKCNILDTEFLFPIGATFAFVIENAHVERFRTLGNRMTNSTHAYNP